jgi:protein involved in polysaccharide export with SLBB domain
MEMLMTTSIWNRRVMPGCLGAVLAALGVLQLFPAPALSAEYVLGPQDKIRLKVVEWRAGKAEYYEWVPFGGEYTVNPAGRVSFPMIGEITAEGRTSDQLARAVTAELYKRTGLMGAQEAAVEIVQYRPFYVLGDVDRPGEFAFRPGLSVLQAVSVAGGLQRLSETGKRDQITAGGNLEAARLELRRTYIRRARLEAELAEQKTITLPPELAGEDVGSLLAEEATILITRRDALQSQLTALSELRSLYEKEVVSLESKRVTQAKQIALAQRELNTVGTLVDKGLAVTSRQFALERMTADLQSGMLDVETALVRAKQEMRKTERDATDLVKDNKAKVSADLREAKASIEQLINRMNMSETLAVEATMSLRMAPNEGGGRSLVYWIQRRKDGALATFAAGEGTLVEPGDVVRVEVHRAPNAAASASRKGVATAESNSGSYATIVSQSGEQ